MMGLVGLLVGFRRFLDGILDGYLDGFWVLCVSLGCLLDKMGFSSSLRTLILMGYLGQEATTSLIRATLRHSASLGVRLVCSNPCTSPASPEVEL